MSRGEYPLGPHHGRIKVAVFVVIVILALAIVSRHCCRTVSGEAFVAPPPVPDITEQRARGWISKWESALSSTHPSRSAMTELRHAERILGKVDLLMIILSARGQKVSEETTRASEKLKMLCTRVVRERHASVIGDCTKSSANNKRHKKNSQCPQYPQYEDAWSESLRVRHKLIPNKKPNTT